MEVENVFKKKDVVDSVVESKVEESKVEPSVPVEHTYSAWQYTMCDLMKSLVEEMKKCNEHLQRIEELAK